MNWVNSCETHNWLAKLALNVYQNQNFRYNTNGLVEMLPLNLNILTHVKLWRWRISLKVNTISSEKCSLPPRCVPKSFLFRLFFFLRKTMLILKALMLTMAIHPIVYCLFMSSFKTYIYYDFLLLFFVYMYRVHCQQIRHT